jgi:hypothetical protein
MKASNMLKVTQDRIQALIKPFQPIKMKPEVIAGDCLLGLQVRIKQERGLLDPGIYKKGMIAHRINGDLPIQVRMLAEADLNCFNKQWLPGKSKFPTPAEDFAKSHDNSIFQRTLILSADKPYPTVFSYLSFMDVFPAGSICVERMENAFWNRGPNRLAPGTATILWGVLLESAVLSFRPGENLNGIRLVQEAPDNLHNLECAAKDLLCKIFFKNHLYPSSQDVIEALINFRLMCVLRGQEEVAIANLAEKAGINTETAIYILQQRLNTWHRLN